MRKARILECCCIGLIASALWPAAWAQPTPELASAPPASSVGADASMQQVIDAVRRRKAMELDAATRRLLGQDALPALPAARPAARERAASDQAGDRRRRQARAEPPRLWSLTGAGARHRAEVVHDGVILQLAEDDVQRVKLGPWTVQSVSARGVTLSRRTGAPARRTESLLLPPPQRGRPLTQYRLAAPGLPEDTLQGLSASAVRAAALPFDAPMAAR